MTTRLRRAAIAAYLSLSMSALCVVPSFAQDVSAGDVTFVEFDGGAFQQVAEGKWVELGPDAKIRFRFKEVSRDESAVVLEDADRGISITLDVANNQITFGAIGDAQQDVLYQNTSASAEPLGDGGSSDETAKVASDEPAPEGATIDQFLKSLKYDPKIILKRVPDGSTEADVEEGTKREPGNNKVIITTTKRQTIDNPVSSLTILNPTAGVVFPGALILADVDLVDGRPTPITLPRSPVTIFTNLPGMKETTRTITDPEPGAVQNALTDILDDFNNNAASDGYGGNAQAAFTYKQMFTSEQAAGELGFGATWADGEASGLIKVSGESEQTSVMAFYKQVFYTVAMNPPRYPSQVFSSDLPVEDLAGIVGNSAPPAYVRSVDYGRILMVRMDSAAKSARANAEGAFKQALEGGEVSAELKAEYERINKSASYSAVVLGGTTEGIKKFSGSDDGISNLKEYIDDGVAYSKENPGIPVSYNVAFLGGNNTNKLATIGLTGDYTQRESIEYLNGYVKLRHTGGYIARFVAMWIGSDGMPGVWASGEVTAPWNGQVDVPGDAKNLRIFGEGQTGLLWQPWNTALNLTLSGPNNLCYKISGTTLNQTMEVSATPQDPCP